MSDDISNDIRERKLARGVVAMIAMHALIIARQEHIFSEIGITHDAFAIADKMMEASGLDDNDMA